MTPTEICRTRGIDSLDELSEITETSKSTLMQWARNGNIKFLLAVLAAEEIKESLTVQLWLRDMKDKINVTRHARG